MLSTFSFALSFQLRISPSLIFKNILVESLFYLLVTIKTINGHETFAKFFVGNNRERAHEIFNMLQASSEVSETALLHLEFMETKNNLPFNLDIKSCTLNQLAENCKIIIKEVFKLVILE